MAKGNPPRCAVCRKPFTKRYTELQQVCGWKCAAIHAQVKKQRKLEKQAVQSVRKRNETSKSHQMHLAQRAFNAWIRFRDRFDPCISCDTFEANQWDCGHYLTVGAHPELRFDEDNAHKQCCVCNDGNKKSGNITQYRIRLVRKIGIERVERLEGPHVLPNWRLDDYIDIKKNYQLRLREDRKNAD